MELSKRKLFFLIIGFSGVILIILANFVGLYSSDRVYVVAANFHNSSLSYLASFNMNISILSQNTMFKSGVDNLNNSLIFSGVNNSLNIRDRNRVNVGKLENASIDNSFLHRGKNEVLIQSLSDFKETGTNNKDAMILDNKAHFSDANDGNGALKFEPESAERFYSDDETGTLTTISAIDGKSSEDIVKTELKSNEKDKYVGEGNEERREELGGDLANVHSMFIENKPIKKELEPQLFKTDIQRNTENLDKNMHDTERVVDHHIDIHSEFGQQHLQKDQFYDPNPANVIRNSKLSEALFHGVGIKMSDSNVDRIKSVRQASGETSVNDAETGDHTDPVNDESKVSQNIHRAGKVSDESVGFVKNPSCSSRPTMAEDILCLKRPDFLSDYRNPCWYEGSMLRCLPYFYIIGVCKTGSTDLFERLSHHPHVLKNNGLLGKETWYWSWSRYGHSNFYRSYRELMSFDEFIDKFDAYNIRSITKRQPNGTLYHPAVTGHGDPMDFWDHSSWQMIPQNDPSWNEPNITTPRLVKHVNPNIKLILLLRDPVERLFSNYLHGKFGETAEEFHDDVLTSLSLLSSCRERQSMKSCLYDSQIIQDLRVPISGSFYSIHLKEWLKVFPRKQIFIIKTEDFSTNVANTLLRIFRFLKLDPIPTRDLYRIANMPHFYDTKAKLTAGEIHPETREILDTLFEPYNSDLVTMLNDENFNFNAS